MGLALLSGLRDSSLYTVAQDFAFKLGENGQHARKCSPAWRGQIKRFAQGDKTDTQRREFLKGTNQIE
jgi:hypothetical protein